MRRTYNITTPEPIDVTELFYQKRNLEQQCKVLSDQVLKLEKEITRMGEHIEQESARIAAAVEAAKVNVENRIEQTRNR